MDKIKLLLVEDDKFYQRIIEKIILSNFPEITISAKAADVKTANELILKHEPQVLVLDVNLPDGTAFDLLRNFDHPDFRVVFVSAYKEYVMDSLKFSFVDFVFKPFDAADLIVAVNDAIQELEKHDYHLKIETLVDNLNSSTGVSKMILPGDELHKVNVDDIKWAYSVKNGSIFFLNDGNEYFTPVPLRRFELLLRTYGFVRPNPRALINMAYVKFMDEKTCSLYFEENIYVHYEQRKTEMLRLLMNEFSKGPLNKLHV
jgi:two-component system LytT family response regulator